MNLPHTPEHTEQWLERYFKQNYYKKPYDRFKWWRGFVQKNKPLHSRVPLRDRILNGDFDLGSYKFEVELVEHRINKHYCEFYSDQGRYVEATSLDRSRRKRLLEDFEADESRKLKELSLQFSYLTGITEEEVLDEMADYTDTLIEFYFHITEKYSKERIKSK